MWHSPGLKMVLTRFHTKNYPGIELATGWEKKLIENWRQDRTVNSKAQRLSSKEGDFFHDRDGISQSMQRGSLSESSLRKRSQGHAGSRADPRKQGQWGNWNQESKEA